VAYFMVLISNFRVSVLPMGSFYKVQFCVLNKAHDEAESGLTSSVFTELLVNGVRIKEQEAKAK